MIADIIHKVAQMGSEEEHTYHPRPSMAGPERCIRQMVYHSLDVGREPLPGRSLMVMDDSRWHEELTADWIRQTAYQFSSQQMKVEIKFPDFPSMFGSIDGILTDITGRDTLLEHKAINHFTFQRIEDGELPLDYLTQCALYLRGIQGINPDIKYGLLLAKNKNTSAYLEFLLVYEEDSLTVLEMVSSRGKSKEINFVIHNSCENAFKKFEQVADYSAEKILPKRQYFIDDWQCSYCNYGKICWESYKEEFGALKTAALLPEEVETMVRYYRELGGQKRDITKEYEELSDKIKTTMKEIGVREGSAGSYICKLTLNEVKRIDKEKLTLEEIERATVKGFSERLTISENKRRDISNE